MALPKSIQKVSLEELTKPKHGSTAYVDCWWVGDDEGVYLYVTGKGISCTISPQCNRDERVAQAVLKRLYPESKIIFVPLAYLNMPTW